MSVDAKDIALTAVGVTGGILALAVLTMGAPAGAPTRQYLMLGAGIGAVYYVAPDSMRRGMLYGGVGVPLVILGLGMGAGLLDKLNAWQKEKS